MLLLGLAYTDLGKFDHAKFYLDEAKEEYKQHPQYYNDLREQGLNRNFGLLFSAKGDSEKAIDYFLKASKYKNNGDHHELTNTFLLAKEYYNSGNKAKGRKYANQGILKSINSKNTFFEHRFKILKSIHEKEKYEQTLKEGISVFKKEGNWEFVVEFSKQLADYYKEKGQYKAASYYYELAVEGNEQISLRGRV